MTGEHIAIVGAGVLDLTSAFELRERGYKVTILARDLPQDIFSGNFASPWAGANWCSYAALDDEPAQRRDEITFRKWLDLVKVLPPEVMAMMEFTDISPTKREAKDVWYSKLVPYFRVVEPDANGTHVIKYKSFTINVPLYTRWLVSELVAAEPAVLKRASAGPPVEMRRCSTLGTLSAALSAVGDARMVVNATGLGARDLGDVRDERVHPIRGQTVLVSVPAFQGAAARCVMQIGTPSRYVIPRARSGNVILGGTFDAHQATLTPDSAIADAILRDCAALVPELVPPGKTWRDIPILAHNVGLRPGREGGVRVQLHHNSTLPAVHAYGIGIAGYQASFGIAHEVADIVDHFFASTHAPARL